MGLTVSLSTSRYLQVEGGEQYGIIHTMDHSWGYEVLRIFVGGAEDECENEHDGHVGELAITTESCRVTHSEDRTRNNDCTPWPEGLS
ncbi:hypothetical protein JCM31271_28310 [Halorubrum trueperi]